MSRLGRPEKLNAKSFGEHKLRFGSLTIQYFLVLLGFSWAPILTLVLLGSQTPKSRHTEHGRRHGAANRAGLGLIGLRRFPIVAHRLKPNFGLHLKDLKQRLSLQQQIGIMNGPMKSSWW